MLKIDNNLLIEIGLGGLPENEKNSFLKHIYETLEMRVGVRLADQMTNQQLDEFEQYFEAKDDAGAFKWLETNFPNYKEIVQQEFDKLKAEVAQSAPQILSASQAAAAQPPVTGEPQQSPMSPGAAQPGMPLNPAQQPMPPTPQAMPQTPPPAPMAQPAPPMQPAYPTEQPLQQPVVPTPQATPQAMPQTPPPAPMAQPAPPMQPAYPADQQAPAMQPAYPTEVPGQTQPLPPQQMQQPQVQTPQPPFPEQQPPAGPPAQQ